MNDRKDLLFAALALRGNLASLDHLIEAARRWSSGEDRPLADILCSVSKMGVSARTALETEVRSLLQGGSDDLLGELDSGLEAALPDLDIAHDDKTLPPGSPFSIHEKTTRILDEDEGGSERYERREELGRGGLGRVLAAVDRILGRDVAVKEMIRSTDDANLLQRFLREGEVAGRLMHPNIVPVFDVGVREGRGGKTPYFVMGRIVGRDLSEILRGSGTEGGSGVEEISRPRLLRIFQDVCLAMAYAHDHGVIHRDLKPANVMVGEYGEVFVVDWGLAKVKGQPEEPLFPTAGEFEKPDGSGSTALTVAGEVLGTPSYMPPEQAEGRISEVDEHSDIYSLGAILYEILTFQPPFTGPNKINILAQVMKDEPVRPSLRASVIRSNAGVSAEGETVIVSRSDSEARIAEKTAAAYGTGKAVPASVPDELEEIVLKAMARKKEDRYGSVMEIHDDVQDFLEGEKEKERNRENARRKVEEGREVVRSLRDMREEVRALKDAVHRARIETKTWWPVERKRDLWALERKYLALQEDLVATFTLAGSTFQGAFEFEPGNKEARAALADLYWDQFLREEDGGNRAEMIIYENLVRQYNDGQYDTRLEGRGTLSVATRRYPCDCLRTGRKVEPDLLRCGEFHLFSGRSLQGRPNLPGLPHLEPSEPVNLKVHGPECSTEAVEGSDAWLFRFELRDQILVPVFPEGIDVGAPRAVPDSVLDLVYNGDSPYRPGEGLHLGKTPVPEFALPMGSYLLLLDHPDFLPVRIPVRIVRLGSQDLEVNLYGSEDLPAGFVQIPAGAFIFQGDREQPHSRPKQVLVVDDLFIQKHPVTCREYVEFLNALARRDPAEALARSPRGSEESGYFWPQGDDGSFEIPTAEWLEKAPPEQKDRAHRLLLAPEDWHEDWPVLGVSWEDAMAFASWARERDPFPFSLPYDSEWEKAARGVDGRALVWGNHFDGTFCNMNLSFEKGMRPVPVQAVPTDESPYGVRGMAGNAVDPCLNEMGMTGSNWRVFCGGSWGSGDLGVRATYRLGIVTSAVYPPRVGIRLCVRPQLPASNEQ